MTTTIVLTNTQTKILEHAIEQNHGEVAWFPEHIKGGARQRVIDGLQSRGLISEQDNQWQVTQEGYAALGRESNLPKNTPIDQNDTSANIAPVKGHKRHRETSKQAFVLLMLKRPEGATVADICAATDWLPHTVRGTFAGAFKKKQGLAITSEKTKGCDRVYRLIPSPCVDR